MILTSGQEDDFPTFETLSWDLDQNASMQDWMTISSTSRRGSSSSQSVFGSLLTRIVAEEDNEDNLYIGPKQPAATMLLQQTDFRNRRQKVVVEKVGRLLSPDPPLCLSSLLSHAAGPGQEHHDLDLASLPTDSLINTAFQEPAGLNTFIKASCIRSIQADLQSPSKPSIHVADISLLVSTLAWGALLNDSIEAGTKMALINLACDASKALFHQKDTIRKFLSLVATLCFVEKTGSEMTYTLLVKSASTAAALGLHLEPSTLHRCVGDDEVVQVQRAMWMLYCIEKSFALRVQTFSVSSGVGHLQPRAVGELT
ncbi:hypothetical protein SLS54_000007 [Diplodia seriata]